MTSPGAYLEARHGVAGREFAGVQAVAPCLPEKAGGFAICSPHTRGECVCSMVMSVGRSAAGVEFPGVELPGR